MAIRNGRLSKIKYNFLSLIFYKTLFCVKILRRCNIILVENQKVKIMWSKKIYKHYVESGYQFTNWGDYFDVDIKDLLENSKEKVLVICDYCHKEYLKVYRDHCSTGDNKDCCLGCRAKKIHETDYERRKNKAFDALEKFCKQKDYELITKRDEFTGGRMKITYKCKKHGIQTGSLDNMIHGHGCIDCQHEKVRMLLALDKDEVEKYINSYNGNILLNKDEYINANTRNLKVKCGICGEIFITSFSDYKFNSQRTCRSCGKSMSTMERQIYNLLNELNIKYKQQKTFDDCRGTQNRKLLFDFYLPDYNLIIEYDGEGHYLEKFYTNRFEDTAASLKSCQERDNIKTQYCINNGIELLRIPYWKKKNINNIIINKLNEIKNNKKN